MTAEDVVERIDLAFKDCDYYRCDVRAVLLLLLLLLLYMMPAVVALMLLLDSLALHESSPCASFCTSRNFHSPLPLSMLTFAVAWLPCAAALHNTSTTTQQVATTARAST
jgi:hypothetical protein